MGNDSRTKGDRVFRSRRPDAFYFDKLPPAARRALANAMFCWSAGACYVRWKRGAPGFETGAAIARTIREWDEDASARSARTGMPVIRDTLQQMEFRAEERRMIRAKRWLGP
jgi:hypothetical protein